MKPTSPQQRLTDLRYAVLLHVQTTHKQQTPANVWAVADALLDYAVKPYAQKHPIGLMGWAAIFGAGLVLSKPWQHIPEHAAQWLQSKYAQNFYQIIIKQLKERP